MVTGSRGLVVLLALFAAVLLAAGCDDGGTDAPPIAPPEQPLRVTLEPALGGRIFDLPIEISAYPGARLFVAQQDGRVLLTDEAGSDLGVLLDISDRVGLDPGEGLLSVALAPDFEASGHLWTWYFAVDPPRTALSRFEVTVDLADPASELVALEVEQPGFNQNGGAIRFGPDGMLYLSIGDGSASVDPFDNGQNLATLLATVIRIDVRDASLAEPYWIPEDNPFVDRPGARPEIWAYGLRNPWRMAFDTDSGALWLGDVGASSEEEINRIERGGNYGWSVFEAHRCVARQPECDALDAIPPVATFLHSPGRCAAIGGLVYRGEFLPELDGLYLYADLCSGQLWGVQATSSGPTGPDELNPREIEGGTPGTVTFGLDAAGEVLIADLDGRVWQMRPSNGASLGD